MSNILKVTSPVVGYDNANAVKTGPIKNTDPSIQGQVNPEKVVKADARSDSASQEQNVGLKFQYESNYNNFIQQMKEAPSMTEIFSKVFFERFSTLAEAGLSEEFAQKIAKFFSMVDVAPGDMLAFVKNQGSAAVRFNGAFFSLLKQVMDQTGSVELKSGILEFLRRYTDMSESPHIMKNIGNLLESLKGGLFQNAKEQLTALTEGLNYQAAAGSGEMESNTGILREQILPFLNKNISVTHDRGTLREMTALLAAYIARCENGTAPRLMDAFDALMQYQGMQKYFQGFDSSLLPQVLANTEFEKATRQQNWMKQLADLIDAGLTEGNDSKAMFKNLMQSILLNESVYMPVLHMMIPLNIAGQLMFAEMWVDPDAEGQAQEGDSREKVVQGLLKFDIQGVGFFDLYFVYQDGHIRLQMNCPGMFDDKLGAVRGDLTRILKENGIEAEEMFVETGQKSIPVSDAFNKIFERKNSINVRI